MPNFVNLIGRNFLEGDLLDVGFTDLCYPTTDLSLDLQNHICSP